VNRKKTLLEVRNLTVTRGGKTIFQNLNLSVFEGEKLILAGPNGVGKTTFAETVLGFVPFEGQIIFEGKPVRTENDFKLLRRKVGYVFQNPDDQLFMPTVYEELAFGPENLGWNGERIDKIIQTVAERLNITHLLERNTFELSFGQKRLVSIACILTMEPVMLILDEPTNGLDRENWQRVVDFLKETDKTLMVISHDREFIHSLGWKVLDFPEGLKN